MQQNQNFNIKRKLCKKMIICHRFLTLFITDTIHFENVIAMNFYVSKSLVVKYIKQKFKWFRGL